MKKRAHKTYKTNATHRTYWTNTTNKPIRLTTFRTFNYSPFRKGSTADSAGRDLFSLPKIPRLSVIRRLLRSLRSRVAGTPFTNGEWGVLRWPSEGGTYAHPAQFDTQFFWYNYIVLFIDFRITKRGYCLSGVEGHYFMAAPRLCSGNKI